MGCQTTGVHCALWNFAGPGKAVSLHEAAATEARFFDLAILECTAELPDTRIIAEAVIFGSGRPTIVFPNKTFAGPIKHLVIAWDGSRASARAVNDASLLIRKAQRVTILSLTGEKPLPEITGAHLAEILVSSGVNATATTAHFTSSSIGLSIQQAALGLGADILVMGAFGHSRLRDFILGGATDGVLERPILPVLMSH